jgi:hypothetical protein
MPTAKEFNLLDVATEKSSNTLQKAIKTLAALNTTRLNTTLYLTLSAHLLFWLLRLLITRARLTRTSLLLYIILSAPQMLIQLFFERQSRPVTNPDGSIKRAGEDLDAKGLTEYMWDVVYWTYLVVTCAGLFGDRAWWLWAVIPLYGGYAAWSTYTGMRGGYQDATGVPQPGAAGASKRQVKMEKRGGQKVQYR